MMDVLIVEETIAHIPIARSQLTQLSFHLTAIGKWKLNPELLEHVHALEELAQCFLIRNGFQERLHRGMPVAILVKVNLPSHAAIIYF